jgi:Cu+-exporting ATPase
VAGRSVTLGNLALMRDRGIDVTALAPRADELRREGGTVMFVGMRACGMPTTPVIGISCASCCC